MNKLKKMILLLTGIVIACLVVIKTVQADENTLPVQEMISAFEDEHPNAKLYQLSLKQREDTPIYTLRAFDDEHRYVYISDAQTGEVYQDDSFSSRIKQSREDELAFSMDKILSPEEAIKIAKKKADINTDEWSLRRLGSDLDLYYSFRGDKDVYVNAQSKEVSIPNDEDKDFTTRDRMWDHGMRGMMGHGMMGRMWEDSDSYDDDNFSDRDSSNSYRNNRGRSFWSECLGFFSHAFMPFMSFMSF